MDFPVSYLKEIMHYNPDTGVFICKVRTGPKCFPGEPLGKTNEFGHRTIGVCCKNYPAHRLAYYYMTGTPPPSDLVIDHRDHNPDNNKWNNLRLVDVSTNNANRGNARTDNNKSMVYPGVYFKNSVWYIHHTPQYTKTRCAIVRTHPDKETAIQLKKHLQMGGEMPAKGQTKFETYANINSILNKSPNMKPLAEYPTIKLLVKIETQSYFADYTIDGVNDFLHQLSLESDNEEVKSLCNSILDKSNIELFDQWHNLNYIPKRHPITDKLKPIDLFKKHIALDLIDTFNPDIVEFISSPSDKLSIKFQ